MEYDNRGKIREGLATAWEWDADSLTWTFHLRDENWVDCNGEVLGPVTAQDFVDALAYVLNPDYASSTASLVTPYVAGADDYYNYRVYRNNANNGTVAEDGTTYAIDANGTVTAAAADGTTTEYPAVDFSTVGVKAVDDHTLTYTLNFDFPGFLSLLSYTPYEPAYGPLLEEFADQFCTSAETACSCGAFYLAEYTPLENWVMKKNPENYDADSVYIDTVRYIYNQEELISGPEMVKRGEIDLICVKDFSRFSRDYIETGNYLECTFPFMGVRFISINDGYDSDDYKGTTGGLEVVMRSIIYAAYSKDLSVKTTSAKIQMMKQGKYVGGYAPYGYVLHPTIRNKLAVDPEAADVIRRIFREALEGSNTSQIARSLNDDGIPTPGQYFKSKHPDKKKFSNMSEKISWETVMVYNILKNLVYTGTLVSRKMKSCGVGSKKRVVNEPIIVEGTHEAIISKEDFELAQKVIRGGGRNPTRKQHDYPLKGLVRCGNCKRAMTRRKNKAGIRYFQCIHSVNNGNTDCPVGRSFPEMDIEKVVFHALTQFLALAQKEAIQNREVGDLRKSAIKECADKIRTLQKQNEQHKASKLRLYEKYAAGSITKEAYIQQKAATDVKIAENDGVIQRSHERMKELDSETACSDEKLDAVCEQYADCKALTYELTHAFISAVYIYDLDNIEIVWKFKDFLTTSEGEAK